MKVNTAKTQIFLFTPLLQVSPFYEDFIHNAYNTCFDQTLSLGGVSITWI